MAGGDGSMALVASLAAEHGVAFVCLPAGTHNHLALDLGVRREDLVGALDAFCDGVEGRVDLGVVNGRVFVNNVSLGVYAEAVQEPGYRAAKPETIGRHVHKALGPHGVLPTIGLTDDLGRPHDSAAVLLVSNNPTRWTALWAGHATTSGRRHPRRRPLRAWAGPHMVQP